jgi:hypothetical protein
MGSVRELITVWVFLDIGNFSGKFLHGQRGRESYMLSVQICFSMM